MTRPDFELRSAPRILTKILKNVLEKRKMMEAPTNLFIDDILVDETMVAVSKVLEHLTKFVLATKHPEPVEEGAKLGLRLERDSP